MLSVHDRKMSPAAGKSFPFPCMREMKKKKRTIVIDEPVEFEKKILLKFKTF